MKHAKLLLAALVCACVAASGCAVKKKDSSLDQVEATSNIATKKVAVQGKARNPLLNPTVSKGKENEAYCTLALVRPINGPMTSDYGVRRHPTLKKRKFHKGIDISAKRGTYIRAASAGTVTFSGRQRGYGNVVKIDHGGGVTTLYAHMDKILVKKGQKLKRAARIGHVGSTGRATGPHLHFEMIADGTHRDPVPQSGWITVAENEPNPYDKPKESEPTPQ